MLTCIFLPISFNLAQSIYESPFYWMQEDKEYNRRASDNRGHFAENAAADILRRVFGKQNVYQTIKVMKSKSETLSDIDVLAVAGNKAVIIQAKSKKLTTLAKTGNIEQIKKDFKAAIQDAYQQGLICRKSILDKSNDLIDKDGNLIKLNEGIDEAYLICLTSDNYPAVTHQVNLFLKKQKDDPYPIAINIFDLEILSDYLQDPFHFLYYLRQRMELMEYFRADNEMSYLGWHLKKKLFRQKEYDYTAILSDFAQLIDANYPVLRGYQVKTKASEKILPSWSNAKFQEIEKKIKETKEPGFTDALFLLYDLAGKGADDLIDWIDKTKKRSLDDGKPHSFSIPIDEGKSGITFVSQKNNIVSLQNNLLQYSVARKYRSKANIWLGLGSIATSAKIIDAVVFNKDPWAYNEDEEKLAKQMLKKGDLRTINGNKIGRNDPCFCGSGKKFKKCCG